MKPKPCEYCKSIFTPTYPNTKYCAECVIKVKEEKVKKLNENRKAEYRKNVIEIKKKKKDGINPYFLKRK